MFIRRETGFDPQLGGVWESVEVLYCEELSIISKTFPITFFTKLTTLAYHTPSYYIKTAGIAHTRS
jgi:hypothetical protein